MATIKDIANRLGVAVSTVSKGLNGANDISDDMRQLILDTAVEMGYVTKRMKKEEHKKLCIFIENIDFSTEASFGYDIILGFKQSAIRDNWSVDLVPITPAMQSAERYDSYMLRHGYSGAYLVGFALEDDWMRQLGTTTYPTVLFDNYIDKNPNVCSVGTDSDEGFDLCLDMLVRLGHTKIALLNGSLHSMITEQRTAAFEKAMKKHGLEIGPEMLRYGHYVAESAKHHVPILLEEGATAIMCSSDLIAMGVISECTHRGFHVPEDISVIGYDDLPIAKDLIPPLTTIRQDRLFLGKTGYTALAALIDKIPISRTIMRAQLIERSTTAPAKNREKAAAKSEPGVHAEALVKIKKI